MPYRFSIDYDIGNTAVCLTVTHSFIPAVPMLGPTWSSGGQPAEPAEVDIQSIEWSLKPDGKDVRGFEWHKIEPGPLFDLIANDEYLYIEICDAQEAREYA